MFPQRYSHKYKESNMCMHMQNHVSGSSAGINHHCIIAVRVIPFCMS